MAFDVLKYAKSFFKLPRPAQQAKWAGEYEALAIHIYGEVPKKLIAVRRPYEDEVIKKFREDNYEAITKGPFSRFNSDLSRVFSGAQVTVTVENANVQDFIEGSNFDGMDLRTYWSRKVARRMILDPNGLLIRWVDAVPDAANEAVEPRLLMLLSKNILHLTDEVASWMASEKSEVDAPDGDGGRATLPVGDVYHFTTKDAFYKLRQIGKVEEQDYELIKHYAHGLGRLPLDVLGGEEVMMVDSKTNEDILWFQSFVSNAIPFANECARQWSDHQGVLVTSGYPMKEVEPMDCVASGCRDGFVHSVGPDDKTVKSKCPTCGGRGKVPPFTPYGVLIRKRAGALTGGDRSESKDMVKYLNPDPAILEFGNKTWREYKADLEKELNQLFVEEAQSGVAKDIDREGKVAKLDAIGSHLFAGLMKRTILDFAHLMFERGVKESDVSISLPPTFVVRNEEDLTAELKSLREGFAPFQIDGQVWLEYVHKRFPGNTSMTRVMSALAEFDPLFGMGDEDIIAARNGGIIDDLMVRHHTLGFAALQRLVKQKGIKVLDADDLFAQVEAMIEELMPAARIEESRALDNPVPEDVPPLGGNAVQ